MDEKKYITQHFPLTLKGKHFMNMVAIPAKGKKIVMNNEKKQNDSIEIQFEHDYYIAEYPVTQELYEAVMQENPSYFKGKKRPVETVSWEVATVFCEKITGIWNEVHPEKRGEFRLPAEAEWEFAARGANLEEDFGYSGSNVLDTVGWYYGDGNKISELSNGETKPVGLKLPNLLGLYDMSGNVWEWCQDFYGAYKDKPKNGTAYYTRVLRGGSWNNDASRSRLIYRHGNLPEVHNAILGFRLVFISLV